jgi:phosphatidylglycerol:prolipoprotein diacylglycerol transferase
MGTQAFSIGSVTIYWYGLTFSMAFMLCGAVWAALSSRRGFGVSMGFEFGFWLILSSVAGARLAFIIANLSTYMQDPGQILQLRSGGLIFYGGILGGLLMTLIFARLKKMPIPSLLDIAAAGTPLGHSMGRLGCYINGCCYGIHGEGPGTTMTNTGLRVPVQLIESAGTLVVFMILWRTFQVKAPWGRTAALYLVLYGLLRFSTEFLRGDPRSTWGPLHMAQWLSAAAIVAGILWLQRLRSTS